MSRRLENISGFLQLQEKLFEPPGTPGVFEKLPEAWKTFQSFYNFSKIILGLKALQPPEVFETFLEAQKTF